MICLKLAHNITCRQAKERKSILTWKKKKILLTSVQYKCISKQVPMCSICLHPLCICLHEHITCECQFQCADAHLMMDYVRGWERAEGSAVCVCVFWLLHHPPAETLKCGQTHADWWPSIMHMAVGSGNLRYHQGQLVCPCWKPPISTDGWLQFPLWWGRKAGKKASPLPD